MIGHQRAIDGHRSLAVAAERRLDAVRFGVVRLAEARAAGMPVPPSEPPPPLEGSPPGAMT